MRWSRLVVGLVAAVGMLGGCTTGPEYAGVYRREAVAADHVLASRAGARVLARGGNAVDAGVATAFALSVVRPYSCGIGGGGFMIVHLQDDPRFGTLDIAIDARETAPAGVGPDYYEDLGEPLGSRIGGSAVGVPGTVAGLLHALETYGTLDRSQVLGEAIALAEAGFRADAHYVRSARELIRRFEEHPDWKDRFAFVWERYLLGGSVREGDLIRVPEQARALRLIAEHGAAAFYEGAIADAIVRAVRASGGVMTHEDLRAYRVREVEPLRFEFYGYELVGMPPPSSGGIAMAQIMGLLERWDVHRAYRGATHDGEPAEADADARGRTAASPDITKSEAGTGSAQRHAARIALLAEAFRHAFSDRARFLGDPAFVDVPVDALLDAAYLDRLAMRRMDTGTDGPEDYGRLGLERAGLVAPPEDDGGTSHFNVVDRWGNAVACTQTINTEFGSLVGVPEFGFCLNNEMDDFTTIRGRANAYGLIQSDRNLPAPGKRPLSSMSPTIVLDARGRVYAMAGASGGPRIITGTVQVLLPMLLIGDAAPTGTARHAVVLPRVHHQWLPDVLRLQEKNPTSPTIDGRPLFPDLVGDRLRALGYRIEPIENVANVQAIRRRADGAWEAASDPNKGGKPAGR